MFEIPSMIYLGLLKLHTQHLNRTACLWLCSIGQQF